VSQIGTRAYVLIETAVGKTNEVASAIGQLEGVTSVDSVTGPYDIGVVVERESLNEVGELVTGKIHPIAGIPRTVTCLAITGV